MHFDVETHTILKVTHGSHAYGLSLPESDLDIKGICIPPRSVVMGFAYKFEQHETHEPDMVIYSLQKFMHLAADCNPNIIEVLFCDDSDIRFVNAAGRILMERRDEFLSRKARHTFSGYAHAQLKRIKTHRSWLLNPPKEPPKRKELGLSEDCKITDSEMGAFETMDGETQVALTKEAYRVFMAERAYRTQLKQWQQYQEWKTNRNAKRSALEARHGYDTKNAMHLVRLMRMCHEILTTGKVIVRRPDREELLAVRAGQWEYDRLIEEAERVDALCEEAYKVSVLPHAPNRAALNELCCGLIAEYCV